MDLSIIIINWNSKDYLGKCICSIYQNTHGLNYEIIVIDNGSYDGSRQMVEKVFPCVNFIQLKENIGFAKANNKAYKVSKGKNLLFLNPDTLVLDNSITLMLRELDSMPEAGIIGPKLLNSDKSIQVTCIRKFPTILSTLIDNLGMRTIFFGCRLTEMNKELYKNANSIGVDAVSGASLMVKRSVFETVGLFSQDYFMYSEDIDLCLKVKKAGYKTYYVPNSTIVHYGSGSSSKNTNNSFSIIMIFESRYQFFRKTKSYMYAIIFKIFSIIVSFLPIVIGIFIEKINTNIRKSIIFVNGKKKWVAILRWGFGLEKIVKR